MASLPDPPVRRNGKTRWIDPEPLAVADWTLCVCMVVLALPVVVVFGPLIWIIRTCDRVGGKAVALLNARAGRQRTRTHGSGRAVCVSDCTS